MLLFRGQQFKVFFYVSYWRVPGLRLGRPCYAVGMF